MKQLRLLAMGVGALAGAGSLVLVACSSDDTIVPVSNPEAGLTDTGSDVAVITDGGTDADAFVDIDAGFTVENLQLNIANAICDTLSRCCYGAELQKRRGASTAAVSPASTARATSPT